MSLLASAARTTSGEQILSGNFSKIDSASFLLTLSAAATEAGDTLDVYIQSSTDDGTTWDDFVHFTQMLGNGGAKKFQAFWSDRATPEAEQTAPGDAALAAGVKQGPVGSKWKVKWVIVDTSTVNASFTFKIDYNATRRPR